MYLNSVHECESLHFFSHLVQSTESHCSNFNIHVVVENDNLYIAFNSVKKNGHRPTQSFSHTLDLTLF